VGFLSRAVGRRITRTLDRAVETPEGQAAIERQRRVIDLARTAVQVAGSGLEDGEACAELRRRLPQAPEVERGAIQHLGTLRTSYLDDRLRDEAVRPARNPRTGGSRLTVGRSEPRVVGPWAESPHPIVNTDLAAGVVREYAAVTGGGRDPDTDPALFYERKKRSFGAAASRRSAKGTLGPARTTRAQTNEMTMSARGSSGALRCRWVRPRRRSRQLQCCPAVVLSSTSTCAALPRHR